MKSWAQNLCMYSASSGVTVPRAQSTAPSALAAHASAGTTSGRRRSRSRSRSAAAAIAARIPATTSVAGYESHGATRRRRPGDAPAPSRAVLLDRESQDDQQERHGHVRRVWLRLRGIEDEWHPGRQQPEGEWRAVARRKHAPRDLPAERQRREAPEEGDQTKRVLALSEDEDGELLEHEPARRGDLAIIERAQEPASGRSTMFRAMFASSAQSDAPAAYCQSRSAAPRAPSATGTSHAGRPAVAPAGPAAAPSGSATARRPGGGRPGPRGEPGSRAASRRGRSSGRGRRRRADRTGRAGGPCCSETTIPLGSSRPSTWSGCAREPASRSAPLPRVVVGGPGRVYHPRRPRPAAMTRTQLLELSAGVILLGGAIGAAAYWGRTLRPADLTSFPSAVRPSPSSPRSSSCWTCRDRRSGSTTSVAGWSC